MAEFKKLSEVEQIETASDNATVLVEEGGEIKRVPKKEVGGAGGYIATITVNDMDNPAVDFGMGPVISENYDEMYEVLCEGGCAWIDVTIMSNGRSAFAATSGVHPTNMDKIRALVQMWMITDIGLMAQISFEGQDIPVLFPNGSHNLSSAADEK